MLAQQVIEEVINRCGKDNQLIVALEELSELSKEITKELRGKGDREHLLEELADVQIMIKQLIYLFDFGKDELFIAEQKKIKRTEERLNDGRCKSI